MMETRDEQVALGEVVQAYAALLGLSERRFVLEFDPDLDMWGQIRNHADYPNSTIVVGPKEHPKDEVQWPFVDREETIAHELVHVLFHPLRQLVWNAVRPALPKPLRKTVWQQYQQHEERIAETVARALVAARRGKGRPGAILVRDRPKEKAS